MTEVTIEFRGTYDEAFELVAQIRAAGSEVSWEPPDHERGDLLQEVIVTFVVTGVVTAVTELVKAFISSKTGASARIDPPDEDPNDPSSTQSD
jgi:hypothetical protein